MKGEYPKPIAPELIAAVLGCGHVCGVSFMPDVILSHSTCSGCFFPNDPPHALPCPECRKRRAAELAQR